MRKLADFLKSSLPATVMLATGLGLTALLTAAVYRLEEDKLALSFNQQASMRAATVQRGMNDAVEVLSTVNRLFVSIDEVTSLKFQRFVQPFLARRPHILALSYQRVVPDALRPGFEALMRTRGIERGISMLSGGKLVPAPQRPSYLVVDFLEPVKGNEAAIGLDLSTNPQVVETIERAIVNDAPASTETLQLAQTSEPGLLVMMPVYEHGVSLDTPEQRRAAMIGNTTAVFSARQLIEKILDAGGFLTTTGFDVEVFAGDDADPKFSIFHRIDGKPVPPGTAKSLAVRLGEPYGDQLVRHFAIGGQPLHMAIRALPASTAATHPGSLSMMLAGIILSLLATAYLRSLSRRSRRIEGLVRDKTAELQLTNHLLREDIVARQKAELALELRHRAIEASSNAIIILSATAPDFCIEYANPAFERISGYGIDEVIGQRLHSLWLADGDADALDEIRAAMRDQRDGNVTLHSLRKSGAPLWIDFYISPVRDASGEVSHFIAALYDITATKRYEAELEFQASRDMLTGLANRNMLRDCIDQAMAAATVHGRPVWVAFVDLDRFKFVNDTLGHRSGDLLLKEVARRLRSAVRDTDTVARLGGDEFVLILPENENGVLDTHTLQRVMDAIAQPVQLETYEFFLTCSIGVAIYPGDGGDAETLIKHADIAMYRAKQTGRNNFQFFTPAMNKKALERLRLEGDLHNALERDEFILHYQPKVDLHTGKIVGMEALIRWRHPQFGMVAPDQFISLAEDNGLIVPIGAWVLRTACEQNKKWQDNGLGAMCVAVNLSSRQFLQKDLAASIKQVLADTGLEASCLEVELTESLIMTDVDHAIGVLRELEAINVQISIDDFGTGYSSLSYLKRFPIALLKIDQSFVRDIGIDDDNSNLTLSIISLGHSLKLKVIAEGVETEEQFRFLQAHGCDQVQGYIFSKPLPAAEFEVLAREWDWRQRAIS